MIIHIGLQLEEYPYLGESKPSHLAGHHFLSTTQFISFLELQLGLPFPSNNNDFIRIEQYRQKLTSFYEVQPEAFFGKSLEADDFATAEKLLALRDELLLAGWDFSIEDDTPKRLATLAAIERFDDQKITLGLADRYHRLLGFLATIDLKITSIHCYSPKEILPSYVTNIFGLLKKKGTPIRYENLAPQAKGNSDLATFQKYLKGDSSKKNYSQNDGSLLIVQAKRDTDAASFITKILQKNEKLRPLCYIPQQNRCLDAALALEGVPTLGIRSKSLGRPMLQILKLIPAFLWRPLDPFKILEFVTLATKPLHDELAKRIGYQMASTPGIKGENWYRMVNTFFQELEQNAQADPNIKVDEIRAEFDFWFNRNRYDADKVAPVAEVIKLYQYIKHWAIHQYEAEGSKNASFIVLYDQARRIVELLESLPASEKQLSYLQVERIVRTIYEPSPVVFNDAEVGRYQYISQAGAILRPCKELLWWDFVNQERNYFFSSFYKKELHYLLAKGIHLQTPKEKNDEQSYHRTLPFFITKERIILIMPSFIDGKEQSPHPLFGNLEACFADLDSICFNIDNPTEVNRLENHLATPKFLPLSPRTQEDSQIFIDLDSSKSLPEREQETFSSLEDLFYYPYKWVFKHKIKLYQPAILSIVQDNTLMGNLSHRIFEKMLHEDIYQWSKNDVNDWVDAFAPKLLEREGAVLLLYGREPEKIRMLQQVKNSAWNLIQLINNNGWKVHATELDLEGKILGIPIRAKADLVLERHDQKAIIDLKWGGLTHRQNLIKNQEDIQLIMYAKLLDAEKWASTAFYIIRDSRMLLRDETAFAEIKPSEPCDVIATNEEIWQRIQKTLTWRLQQIKAGKVEIRTQHTIEDLDEQYGELLLDVLEMRKADNKFDDYRTLINPLR